MACLLQAHDFGIRHRHQGDETVDVGALESMPICNNAALASQGIGQNRQTQGDRDMPLQFAVFHS